MTNDREMRSHSFPARHHIVNQQDIHVILLTPLCCFHRICKTYRFAFGNYRNFFYRAIYGSESSTINILIIYPFCFLAVPADMVTMHQVIREISWPRQLPPENNADCKIRATVTIKSTDVRRAKSPLTCGIKVAVAICDRIVQKAPKGEGKEDILSFLKKLTRKGERLLDVAMDMSNPYFSAVREALPHVEIVYNRYHIMALINQDVDDVRTEGQRKLDILGQTTLKENRF